MPPQSGRSPFLADALLAEAAREGWVTLPVFAADGPPPRRRVMTFRDLMAELQKAREL